MWKFFKLLEWKKPYECEQLLNIIFEKKIDHPILPVKDNSTENVLYVTFPVLNT